MFCSDCGKELTSAQLPCSGCGSAGHVVPIDGDPLARPGLITLLAVLNVVAAGLELLLVVAWFSLAPPQVVTVIPPLIFAAHGLLTLAVAYGLWTLRPFGRVLAIVQSTIGLLAFPLGTIVSILILYYMFRPGIKILFSGKTSERLTVEDLRAISRVRGGNAVAVVLASIALIFVCGIVSAIAIPNFLNAVDRGRQKRTMADMRVIEGAIRRFAEVDGRYPTGGSIDELEAQLVPEYAPELPALDGWGNEFLFESTPESYELRSAGKDGVVDRVPLPGTRFLFNADIVVRDGEFVQAPD